MGTPAILAIDEGTTGVTCLVVTRDGQVAARTYSEFEQHFPQPGWVEHDAAEIWATTQWLAREAIAKAQSGGIEVVGVGVTNQRETIVLWDPETLQPLHRAIVWQDRRTTDLCGELKEAGHEARFKERTGLLLDPYFSGTKLTWLFREHPDLLARANRGELSAGTMDSWLVAQLTGGRVHATDPTNASRTLLYDLHECAWSDELAAILGVPLQILPEVRPSAGDFGTTVASAIGIEVPIGGVAGDQQAALFGQGCWSKGLAKNTYGTGAFMLLHTGDTPVSSEHGLLTTVACDERGGIAYALEGSVFIAGAAIQWLRDGLGILDKASESEAMARSLESNDGVYLVPAFVGLGAPHWVPEARGSIFGLTRGTRREHLVRAALEAMAYGTAEVIEAMEADSGIRTEELRVDGGVALNDWLLEFQAGILDVPVRRPQSVETTAMGAAALAGLTVGLWPSAQAYTSAMGEPDRFESHMTATQRDELRRGWDRAVAAVGSWASDD